MRLILLALAVALAPATAAQSPNFDGPQPQRSAVELSLRVTVLTGDAPVPGVVVALAEDDHLARLSLSQSTHRAPREEVHAQFVFRSVAEYLAWRESDRVMALFAELEEGSQGRGMATALNLRQYPRVTRLSDGG